MGGWGDGEMGIQGRWGDKRDKEDGDTTPKKSRSTHHSLLIMSYSLLITHYSLLITHHSLLITHYSLLIIHEDYCPRF
ncbi:MAG: hypothetical protein F6K47_36795 [Symploca sp. SIO2E6]|nr:hypothetical protein [Symploca sp. SIO2E6]